MLSFACSEGENEPSLWHGVIKNMPRFTVADYLSGLSINSSTGGECYGTALLINVCKIHICVYNESL